VVATVPLSVGPDPHACADPVRAYVALYVGGMGSREQNFYLSLAGRMGFADEAAEIQDRYLSRRPRDAEAAVPYALVDRTSLLGDRARVAEGLARLAASGVTTCALVPYGSTLAERQAALTVAAEALVAP
jgi:alkanesulfonate monooxygenase SsuD/methylene tetrahydromethanopterin reductase-like flavin-dependent oxidoreductase (luciferase family)